MPALGLILAWVGYLFGSYGNALRKGANVTMSDMALPSHRAYALNELRSAYAAPAAPAAGGKPKKGETTVPLPLFPGAPGFGPKIHIPGTPFKTQL